MPGLWTTGWYAALAGIVGAVAAAIFGAIDLLSVVPPRSSARSRGYKHALLNVVALALFIAVVAYRGGPEVRPDSTSLLLSSAGALVLGFSGWLGGTLVYRNQIGIDHRYANAGRWKERELGRWDEPVCREDELAEGQMLLAEVAGSRIVVGRCPNGIVAFGDRCTHRGGPLADGALVGCTVQCPWHGSQFEVHTGRVVNGPAQQRIEPYEIEIRQGEVYVRPRRLEIEKAA
jgi:nitrite reductase/ring-hydroxylating ferredoxin subunit